eukprot:380561_1
MVEEHKYYIVESWSDEQFKSGCCMKAHPINTPMIQCTEYIQNQDENDIGNQDIDENDIENQDIDENDIENQDENDTCPIWYCLEYVKTQLNLTENNIHTLCEAEEVFKCHKHGFQNISVNDFAYQFPIVDQFENETKEIAVESIRTSRQTKQKEKFNVHFKRVVQNGIVSMKIKENDGNWADATKSNIHKYKKHVIKEVLAKLLGYDKVNQKKDKLEKIVLAIVGVEEDARLIVERILGKELEKNVVKLLTDHHVILLFQTRSSIRMGENLCDINEFTKDIYEKFYDEYSQVVDDFLCIFWMELIANWTKHPTDKEFMQANNDFRDSYHELEEYKKLEQIYNSFQDESWFEKYSGDEFCLFAYDLSIHLINLFVKQVKKYLLKVVIDSVEIDIKRKEMNEEQKWYIAQSIGGATANSMKRKTYGGNLGEEKKEKLHEMIDSMLLNCEDYSKAKIAFRLRIENHGLRILTEEWTDFVLMLLGKIQPILRQNVVLLSNGHFKDLLNDLLKEIDIQKSFCSLMDQYKSDFGIKVNDEEMYIALRTKLGKDFISGVFNKALWGYLKQIRPPNGRLSLRNSLRVNLSTATPFSSLQTK